MAESPKPPRGYKAIPMDSNRRRMWGRLLGMTVFLALSTWSLYGSVFAAPKWLWLAVPVVLYIWEMADMIWWNFQALHERLDQIELAHRATHFVPASERDETAELSRF